MSVPSATACGSAIFFNEKVCAPSYRARNKSVTEDYCSWVVNYNGNINNNNRNNTNDVRAVSEFQRKMNNQPGHIAIDYGSLLFAYEDCRRNKAWTETAIGFEIPKKYYLQHYSKGVKFLGMVIKGSRLYIANSTLGKALCRLHRFNRLAEEKGSAYCKANAEHFVCCINSYLGFMRQGQEYGMRRAFCGQISEAWLKYVVVEWDFTKIILKQKYKHRERVKRMLQRKRNKATKNYKIPKAKRMTARVFSGSANVPAAVEQFNTGRKRGCIVRWDFEPVKTTIPEVDKRANFRRRKALSRAAKGEQPVPVEEPQQGKEVDSGMVAYSEMRYIDIPTPERVLSDIEYDLALRYGDQPRPEVDMDAYRTAIAALNK